VGQHHLDVAGDEVGDPGHRGLGRLDLVLGAGAAVRRGHRVAPQGEQDSHRDQNLWPDPPAWRRRHPPTPRPGVGTPRHRPARAVVTGPRGW